MKEVVNIETWLLGITIMMLVGIIVYAILSQKREENNPQQILASFGITTFDGAAYPIFVKAEHAPTLCNGGCSDALFGYIFVPPEMSTDKKSIFVEIVLESVTKGRVKKKVDLLSINSGRMCPTGWRVTAAKPRVVQ